MKNFLLILILTLALFSLNGCAQGWSEFKNEDITFNYPKGFTVTEQGDNVALTNSDSSAPLDMAQGEIWISFSPTTKEANDIQGPSESIADSNIATNGTDSWYKIELLMGGNGQATTEAEEIFEKVNSTFRVL